MASASGVVVKKAFCPKDVIDAFQEKANKFKTEYLVVSEIKKARDAAISKALEDLSPEDKEIVLKNPTFRQEYKKLLSVSDKELFNKTELHSWIDRLGKTASFVLGLVNPVLGIGADAVGGIVSGGLSNTAVLTLSVPSNAGKETKTKVEKIQEFIQSLDKQVAVLVKEGVNLKPSEIKELVIKKIDEISPEKLSLNKEGEVNDNSQAQKQ